MGARERTEVPQNAGSVMIGAEKLRKEGCREGREFRKSEARGGGRHGKRYRGERRSEGRREGEEEGLERESRGVSGRQVLACMVAGNASEEVGALVKFPGRITPGTRG